MQKVWCRINRQNGFSVVEVLLASTVFAALSTALIGAIVFGRTSTAQSGDRMRAVQYAEEALEATRNIRDSGYANIPDGTYGLVQSGGVWTLSGSSDTNSIYTRAITIATSGTNRKTITANVSWPQTVGTGTVNVVTELTNWVAAVATSWLNAIQAGSYNAAGTNDGLKVATVGNYAYIVRNGGTPNFIILNVSNPAAPTLASSLVVANSPTNITVSGNYAYITTSSNTAELQIVNISNPAAPTLAGTFNAAGNANGNAVTVIGNYAYIARAANGGASEFVIANIANPAAPTFVGAYNNNISMNDVHISGNYAFIGTSSNTQELLTINIANPAAPTLAATLDMPGSGAVLTVDIFGNTIFAGRTTTLTSVNITNPLATSVIGTVATTGTATVNDVDLDPTGTYAFLGTNSANAEFQIANITNPASMTIVRTVNISPGTNNMNGVAYNAALDIVVGATNSDTQEAVTFIKN